MQWFGCILHFTENFTEREKGGRDREVSDGERREGGRERGWRAGERKRGKKREGEIRGMEKQGREGGALSWNSEGKERVSLRIFCSGTDDVG